MTFIWVLGLGLGFLNLGFRVEVLGWGVPLALFSMGFLYESRARRNIALSRDMGHM